MADDNLRQDMVDQIREEQQKRPRMARAPRPENAAASQNTTGSAPGDEAKEASLEGSADAPKKRRRRRRSGASRDAGAGESGGQSNDGAREP